MLTHSLHCHCVKALRFSVLSYWTIANQVTRCFAKLLTCSVSTGLLNLVFRISTAFDSVTCVILFNHVRPTIEIKIFSVIIDKLQTSKTHVMMEKDTPIYVNDTQIENVESYV